MTERKALLKPAGKKPELLKPVVKAQAARPTKAGPAQSRAATPVTKAAAKPAFVVKKGSKDAVGHLGEPNVKQERVRRNKAKESNIKMRQHLWPKLDESTLWLHKDHTRKGYTTMPRTIPLIVNLINDISKQVTSNSKAVPAGKTYLVLWCRVFEEGFLKIETEASAALEAGYGGERNVSTWREHLTVLKDLGFIDYRPGPAGPFQYILIFNPYKVVKALHAKGWVQDAPYTALYQRAMDISATDLDED